MNLMHSAKMQATALRSGKAIARPEPLTLTYVLLLVLVSYAVFLATFFSSEAATGLELRNSGIIPLMSAWQPRSTTGSFRAS